MRDIDELFKALDRSKFRSRFRLSDKDAEYFRQKGMVIILEHARDFIQKRLTEANPANDGKQTPMRNHPVFIAQHATGTCCRKCLEKWHYIDRGKPLKQKQTDYIIEVLKCWFSKQKIL